MAEEKVYLTVTALTKYIAYKFSHDFNLKDVLLEGEISNFKHHSRGHFYFTLKDDSAAISAIMFVMDARRVPFEPENGMKVRVKGTVEVYEAGGTYSIKVTEMEQAGIGNLYLAYEKLKKELQAKGYFDESHKKKIPEFPKAIGVITSPTGAAIRDCINTIKRRYPLATIYVYPTLVQGENAKDSIVKNIKLANSQGYVDTLIVGRGGGSIEDLWAFNEEIVAKAIYDSTLPIISAVGHETDFTIADFVADKRAATPTAAAELATPNIDNLSQMMVSYQKRISESMVHYMKNIESNLLHLDQRLESNSPILKLENLYEKKKNLDLMLNQNMNSLLQDKLHQLDLLNHQVKSYDLMGKLNSLYQESLYQKSQLNHLMEAIIKEKESNMTVLLEKLKVLNPLLVMEKGFSVVESNNKIVKSKKDIKTGDIITVRLKDGKIKAEVLEDK